MAAFLLKADPTRAFATRRLMAHSGSRLRRTPISLRGLATSTVDSLGLGPFSHDGEPSLPAVSIWTLQPEWTAGPRPDVG